MGKQKDAGLTNPSVHRSADDGNSVLILWDAEDRQRANDFATAASLKLAMTHVGVVGTPDVTFQEAAYPRGFSFPLCAPASGQARPVKRRAVRFRTRFCRHSLPT